MGDLNQEGKVFDVSEIYRKFYMREAREFIGEK